MTSAGKSEGRRHRMLVLCPYPIGVAAGQRLKFEQYYDDWRAHGWEVTISPFMTRDMWDIAFDRGHLGRKLVGLIVGTGRRLRDLFRIGRYDLIYSFMYLTPVGTTGLERIGRRAAKKLIYDVEDNVLGGAAGIGATNPNRVLRLLRGAGKYRYLAREADHIITSSPALNDVCRQINRHGACTYISSSIDAARFQPANDYSEDRTLTIGWTGTFSSRPFLDLIAPMLQRLASKRDFKLRVIGNFDFALPGVDLEVIRWTAEREVADLQAIDIGLYPLPIDDDWVSGKSGLKAITYMMMGLPCVATAVGTTPLIIRDGENGLLVRTEGEWIDALRRLLDDPGLRRRLGEQARRDAVENYSTDAIAAEYRAVLDNLIG
ncbi:MAG: glycosyltransferase [Sphingomicrobium sp.]